MSIITEWNSQILYQDKFTLYGYKWVEKDGSMYQQQNAAPDIMKAPCYLSVSKNALGNRRRLDQPGDEEGDHNTVERVLMLFCHPKYKISAGDILVVEHCGDTFRGIAGQPHKYLWHQELLLYTVDDA